MPITKSSNPLVLPTHLAIIPDGNRRWAREHGLPEAEGHARGYQRLNELAQVAHQLGIKNVTVWGFSTENWKRPSSETDYLVKLFLRGLRKLAREAKQRHIRIRHLGRKDRLPSLVINYLKRLEQATCRNQEYSLNIALDYGGRDEIIRAVKKIIDDGIPSNLIDEQLFGQYLDTANLPDPDFIIRTSGEQRTSGLLPWQSSYAEYYFSPHYLPDFSDEEFFQALQEFAARDRRFGGNRQQPAN